MQRTTSFPKRKKTRCSKKPTTKSQSAKTKLHGNGYLAKNPTRRQLLNAERKEQIRREELQHQEHVELMDAFGQLQEKMSPWEEEREIERIEHAQQLEESEKRRQTDLQQLRQEYLSMLQATNGPAQVPQVLVQLFA
jgi:hypothetical protein